MKLMGCPKCSHCIRKRGLIVTDTDGKRYLVVEATSRSVKFTARVRSHRYGRMELNEYDRDIVSCWFGDTGVTMSPESVAMMRRLCSEVSSVLAKRHGR